MSLYLDHLSSWYLLRSWDLFKCSCQTAKRKISPPTSSRSKLKFNGEIPHSVLLGALQSVLKWNEMVKYFVFHYSVLIFFISLFLMIMHNSSKWVKKLFFHVHCQDLMTVVLGVCSQCLPVAGLSPPHAEMLWGMSPVKATVKADRFTSRLNLPLLSAAFTIKDHFFFLW